MTAADVPQGSLYLFKWYDLHPIDGCTLVRYRMLAHSAKDIARHASALPHAQNRTVAHLLRNGMLSKSPRGGGAGDLAVGELQWTEDEGDTWQTVQSVRDRD